MYQPTETDLDVLMSKMTNLPPHPRLLMNDNDLMLALEHSKTDGDRDRLHKRIIAIAELELHTSPVEYILARHYMNHGPDIKGQIRKATPTVLGCSMAYRLTRDKRFLDRAVAEMKSLAAFPNWHPVLFLGTSEIATIVSIGYDFLYNDMIESDRDVIADALFRHCLSMAPAIYRMIFDDSESPEIMNLLSSCVERIGGEDNVYLQCGDGGVGINEFARSSPFVTKTNNWNQVCNCGMIAAALAIGDREIALGSLVIIGALRSLPIAMKGLYYPSGCYPEGPQYWAHGTMCNVMAIAMLQSSLNDDFGLNQQAGFNKTLSYRLAVRAPSGLSFNYADSTAELTHEACISWLSKTFPSQMGVVGMKYARAGLVDVLNYMDEIEIKGSSKKKERTLIADRFFTFHAVWFPDNVSDAPIPSDDLDLKFDGSAQLAIFRSSWDSRRAVWAALKAGTNEQSHCHLDLGSFCIDASGVRFAMDLGKDEYSLKKYHSRLEKSPRWNTYMRTNNWGHNTISVAGNSDGNDTPVKNVIQDFLALAPIISFKSTPTWAHAIVDLTNAYPYHRVRHKNKEVNEAKEAKQSKASRLISRGLAMIDRQVLLVQDEIVLTDSSNGKFSHSCDIIWRMFSSAKVTLLSNTIALLDNQGESLKVEILTPSGGLAFSISSADPEVLFPGICTSRKSKSDKSDSNDNDNDDNDDNDDNNNDKKEQKRLRRLVKGKGVKVQEDDDDDVQQTKKIAQDPNDGITLLSIEHLDCLSSNVFESGKKEVTAEFRLSVLFTPIPSEFKGAPLTYKSSSSNVVIKPLHLW